MLRHLFKTLRFKLTVLHLAIFGVLLSAVGIGILALHEGNLIDDIDQRLRARAETIIEEVTFRQEEGLGLAASRLIRPHLNPVRFPSFFWQFRFDDGSVVHRSRTLRDLELPWTATAQSAKTPEPALETIRGEPADTLVVPGASIRMLTLRRSEPRRPPYALQVGLSLASVEHSMTQLRQILFTVIPAGLLAAGIASWLMARRSLAPIARIARQARELTAERLDRRLVEPPGKDEVAEMVLTLNDMLERLEAAFKAQERFVADAAHELKTPIAILLGGAQVLGQKPRERPEYEQFLDTLSDEMVRMAQTVDSLLTLARADAGMPLTSTAPVSINEAVADAVRECQPLAAQRLVRLVPTLALPAPDDPEALVKGDPDLLRVLIANLLRNAVRHSPPDSTVEATVRLEKGTVLIHVCDRGPGIPPEQLELIFDRFYRVERETKTGAGTGLGLAIARGVAQLHHGTITAANRPGGGCEFRVRIPLLRT